MFEIQLASPSVLKKVLYAIKDLINVANFECNDNGITVS